MSQGISRSGRDGTSARLFSTGSPLPIYRQVDMVIYQQRDTSTYHFGLYQRFQTERLGDKSTRRFIN